MSIRVEKAGLLTSIQDKGRWGYQKNGIIVSGPMDALALRVANILVGNKEGDAVIETYLTGLKISFDEDSLIAITGADLSPKINGEPVKMWRPVFIRKDSILEFTKPVLGCFAYLAIAGNFDVPKVMGSSSTYLRAGIGGFKGRPLQAGDIIPGNTISKKAERLVKSLSDERSTSAFFQSGWTVSNELKPRYEEHPLIRAIAGPEHSLFQKNSQDYFWHGKFQVSSRSDRMGYRLKGQPLALTEITEIISSAVDFGTVQVPADGNPIALMADHQTTGGYPRIAQVITADLPKLTQVLPGKTIRFREVSLNEAQQLYLEQEQQIEYLKRAIQIKTGL
jgi:antagonist of KipI